MKTIKKTGEKGKILAPLNSNMPILKIIKKILTNLSEKIKNK